MSAHAGAKRIGGDWVESTDQGTGRKYYANLVTKESRWEYPAELKSDGGGGGGGGGSADAGSWVEKKDPNSGRSYYYNTATNETTWEKPANFASADSKGGDDSGNAANVAANWASREDPSSGRTYYYNKVTMETTWEKPACLNGADSKPANAKPAAPAAAAMPAAAPAAAGNDDPSESKEPAAAPAAAAKPAASTPSAASTPHAMGAQRPGSASLMRAQANIATTGHASSIVERMMLDADDQSTEELCQSVADLKMEDYAENHYNFDRKGLMGAKTTMEKLLSHKTSLIRTSLKQLNQDLATEACQSFRNITGYMGDRNTTKGAVEHSVKLLNNMLLAPEDLRDEVYCQLIKQTTRNPSPESNMKGWELLCILTGSFPPGEELKPFVMHHCASEHGIGNSTPKVHDYAAYVLHRVKKVCRLGPRREIPTPVEIEACRRLLPLNVRVSFLDDRYLTLPVDSWTTAKELEGRCAKMLGIKDGAPFAIYEVSTEEEERVLEPEERILDLVAYWTRLETDERTRKGKSANIEEFRFIYKVRLFLDVPDDDVAGVHLMYIQATHDVVDARYPCTDNDSITLAALQVQEEHGDHPGALGPNPLTGKVSKYIAKKYIEEKGEDALEADITKLYQKLTGYSKREARLSYLDYVKAWKIYGSAYFFAEPQSNREFPTEVVLAINSKGILVVDPDTKDYLAEYTYNNVVTWGHSQNSFVVVTGNITRRVKVYFRTDQGKEMNSIVRAYVEKLMQRSEQAQG
mmetsp:Transcript_24551/g.76972  ORF Transcript_24551/g.76972 Transcript_24551/m.76972 type:complete len:751 (-) Transcript_24551:571-2823(-)